jgi:hypothetical protein
MMVMSLVRLPVSGINIQLRQPDGWAELLLLESARCDTQLAVDFGRAVAQPELEWQALPISDLDAFLLMIRQHLLGDHIISDVQCTCKARVDVRFTISEYLDHHRPDDVAHSEWYQIGAVSFRVPQVADQIALQAHTEQRGGLLAQYLARCIRGEADAATLTQIRDMLSALSPDLANVLNGTCPECGAELRIFFDPQRYILNELRNQALSLYDEVHLIALVYHWSESDILALPRKRRVWYAERIRRERRSAS